MEATDKKSQQFKGATDSIVNKLADNPHTQCCFLCGKQNHKASSCYFKDATFYRCGKKGHISKVCLSASSKCPVRKPKPKSAKWVEIEQTTESDVDSEPALAIDQVEGRPSHPITVKLEVQGNHKSILEQQFPSYLKRLELY